MRERRYLLNIGQMLEGSGREHLFREAFNRIDGERRHKAMSMKNARAQAAGVGAGLLIQKALADYMAYSRTECPAVLEPGCLAESWTGQPPGYLTESRTDREAGSLVELRADREAGSLAGLRTDREAGSLAGLRADREPGYLTESRAEPGAGKSEQQEQSGDSRAADRPVLECFSVEELLSVLGSGVTEPCYRYGKNGKPYLADDSFLFNLSHSGDYVFCGVSEQEIGVDIQKIQGDCGMRLAKRFFADPERQTLEACGDEELRRRMFFRMWVRKEAYGKLTGEGIAGAVEKCLWRDVPVGEESSDCSPGKEPWWEKDLIWEEYDVPDGYRMAVCRFRQIMRSNIVSLPELWYTL